MSPTTGLDVQEEKTLSCPSRESSPEPSSL